MPSRTGNNPIEPPPPDPAAVLRKAGDALFRAGHYADAVSRYDQVLALQPDSVVALANRGIALVQLGRFADALQGLDRAVALSPDYAELHYKRASTLRALNRLDEAVAAYGRVLELQPDHATARNRRGTCLLLAGRFAEGWRDYEARWDEWAAKRAAEGGKGRLLGPANFGKPLWDGRPAAATLLIWCEQGLGEQILFASMLREAAARVQRVILAVEPRLQALFARSFPDCTVTTFAGAVQAGGYDLQIPLGGLGALLRRSTDDFLPQRRAFLKADVPRAQALRARLAPAGARLVGLSWASRNRDTGGIKSLSLETLKPLLALPGLRFVDLQYGDTAAEREALHASSGVELLRADDIDNRDDLDGLAALVSACDVVVSVSNTTAHLAGALGKPVLLLLPHAQGRLWYWQTGRHDTLWYPAVRLLRQHAPGDWSRVVAEARRLLTPPATDGDALQEAAGHLRHNDHAAARAALTRLLAAEPGHAEALQLLGALELAANRAAEAETLLRRALAAQPEHAQARARLGLALARRGQHDDALAEYDHALALQPDLAEAHAHRGVTLNALQRFDDALAAYDRALALDPRDAEAWCNRGVVLNNLNRHRDAIASHDRALELKPDYAAAYWNRALVKLTVGAFDAAWPDFSWRWKKRIEQSGDAKPYWYGAAGRRGRTDLPHGVPCAFDPPLWDGRPSQGSLLVWPEQGAGEQLMYASMLDEARARTGSLTLITDPKLQALLQRSFPDCRIVSAERDVAAGHHDLQCPLGELGRFFRHGEADFLARRRAYLKADAARSDTLRREIGAGAQRVCGLSWFSRNAEFGAQKTLALDALRPLLGLPGLRFVDLQYGDTAPARATILRETGVDIFRTPAVDPWADLDGLAALINACDVVVTISNTTAHLAGALGKVVLLMLPHAQGRFWYWQAAREDSLWYPQVRVFRQPATGDWDDVIARVGKALATR